MVLMMSPRSPSSRRIGSASGDTMQRPVSISVADPMRSSLRARSISSARFWRNVSSMSLSGRRSVNSFATRCPLNVWAGADITVATAAVGALVGGKPVIDAMRKGPE